MTPAAQRWRRVTPRPDGRESPCVHPPESGGLPWQSRSSIRDSFGAHVNGLPRGSVTIPGRAGAGQRVPQRSSAHLDKSSGLEHTNWNARQLERPWLAAAALPLPSEVGRQPEHGARMDAVGIAEDVAVRLEDRLESGADVERCLGGRRCRTTYLRFARCRGSSCGSRRRWRCRRTPARTPSPGLVGARAWPDLDNASCGGRWIGQLNARLPGRNEVRAGDGGLEQYLTVPVEHAYGDGCLESTSGSRE